MKKLSFLATIASLLCATAAVNAAPDFTTEAPPRAPVDPSLVTSDATREIEPDTLVTFALGSDELDSMATSQVLAVSRWMAAHPQHNVAVQGHADRTGTDAFNLELSKRRGERVRAALAQMGIPVDRVVVAAYGDRDARPVEDESDRRVVIFASRRSTDGLAASLLATTKAEEVVWTNRSGAQLREQLNH